MKIRWTNTILKQLQLTSAMKNPKRAACLFWTWIQITSANYKPFPPSHIHVNTYSIMFVYDDDRHKHCILWIPSCPSTYIICEWLNFAQRANEKSFNLMKDCTIHNLQRYSVTSASTLWVSLYTFRLKFLRIKRCIWEPPIKKPHEMNENYH